MAKPHVSSSRKRHITAASVLPEPVDGPVTAPLQDHIGRLERELNMLAQAVVEVDRRRLETRLIRLALELDCRIIFPTPVSRECPDHP